MRPVIIGGGIAGLTVALALAEKGVAVTLLSPDKLGADYTSSSVMAQGGVAAAVGKGDTAAAHARDTIAAGAGLCVEDIVQRVTEDGEKVVAWLEARGVRFDRDQHGDFDLGREAAHGRNRIVHAGGGGTGGVIIRALVEQARHNPLIHIINDATVTDIQMRQRRVQGIVVSHKDGPPEVLPADRVVLATGGAGALWADTTNPDGSWGSGLVLAARAGATLADLEFMQFHPTAIVVPGGDGKPHRMPLASEALRGDGAHLIDEKGRRFMAESNKRWPSAEMEPRDIVARAIWEHLSEGHQVFLDVGMLDFAGKFGNIHRLCRAAGVNTDQPIPVRPAAHYHMGGIVTDGQGAVKGVQGLWAVGEVASTGLQGANRLASNSLLEGVSVGLNAAADVAAHASHKKGANMALAAVPVMAAAPSLEIRKIMSRYAGVLRDRAGLEQALANLVPHGKKLSDLPAPALAAAMVVLFAIRREESRGAHARTDFPEPSAAWKRRQEMTLADMESCLAELRLPPVRHDPHVAEPSSPAYAKV